MRWLVKKRVHLVDNEMHADHLPVLVDGRWLHFRATNYTDVDEVRSVVKKAMDQVVV